MVLYHPTVCPVGNNYQIAVVVYADALISVRVGKKSYFCHTNGIRKSKPGVHKITVPMSELDEARGYTLIAEKMIERLDYYSKTGEPVERRYAFRPIEKTSDINVYHLADVHGYFDHAVACAEPYSNGLDLLVLNGDVSSASDTFDAITLCYKISSRIAKGEIPTVISRGNHDLRGALAEQLTEYMPDSLGKSYYSFRVGCIWGLLVDTGEDKDDSNSAYGHTVCCHDFRLCVGEMIKSTIENPKEEYEADGVRYRLVISHVPFTFPKDEKIFDIERELYSDWANVIKENIKPNLMLSGHTHKCCISHPGDELDELGHPCTVVVGSELIKTEANGRIMRGAYINLRENNARVVFNSNLGDVCEQIIKI